MIARICIKSAQLRQEVDLEQIGLIGIPHERLDQLYRLFRSPRGLVRCRHRAPNIEHLIAFQPIQILVKLRRTLIQWDRLIRVFTVAPELSEIVERQGEFIALLTEYKLAGSEDAIIDTQNVIGTPGLQRVETGEFIQLIQQRRILRRMRFWLKGEKT